MARFGVGKYLVLFVIAATPGDDERLVAAEFLEQSQRLLLQTRVKEQFDVVHDQGWLQVAINDLSQDTPDPQRSLLRGQIEQVLAQVQVEVEVGEVLLAAQLFEQSGFACPVRAGDEEEPVVLVGEGKEKEVKLIKRLLAHATKLSFIAFCCPRKSQCIIVG